MPLPILTRADVPPPPATPPTVGVIGYGNQGRAHALNLRDSGFQVMIGQRAGRSFDLALADGFEPIAVAEATQACDGLVLGLPDESAAEVYASDIAPCLTAGQMLGFIHGFNIHYGWISPPPGIDVTMVSPKGPGSLLRSLFVEGNGLPALLAVHQDATGKARARALAWADGIGSTRAAVLETSFANETETDLFGEQVVLCGGISALTKAAFETLVEAGYDPAFAYLECVHELKQVVDLLYARGLSAMRDAISNTAEYGDLTRGPRIIDERSREEMRRILDEIRSGAFAREWVEEHRAGGKKFRALHDGDVGSEYEKAGKFVRSLMPWLAGESCEL